MKYQYIAFLRGINVGGHHKVPMAELKHELEGLGFEKIETLLNSGNVIFKSNSKDLKLLENKLSNHLEKAFGFPIPTILRTDEMILELLTHDPFKHEVVTKDIRLYVSLLRKEVTTDLKYPWSSDDGSFRILSYSNGMVLSVLDLSKSQTPKAMEALEKMFGKDITTRNWNTIEKIGKIIQPSPN